MVAVIRDEKDSARVAIINYYIHCSMFALFCNQLLSYLILKSAISISQTVGVLGFWGDRKSVV